MTSPAPVVRPVNPVPPEGTPVLVIVEGYEGFHSFLVEIGEEALPGTRVIAVLKPETAYAALVIHAEDVVGLVTNLRHRGGPRAVMQMAEEALGRSIPWAILTGANEPPLPEDFMPHPPLAVQGKAVDVRGLKGFFRLFASPATGEATAP